MMKRALSAAAALSILLAAALAVHAQARSAAEAAALKSLDEYMAAFNSRDAKAWAQTLHYPHVRIAPRQGDSLTQFETILLVRGGRLAGTWRPFPRRL